MTKLLKIVHFYVKNGSKVKNWKFDYPRPIHDILWPLHAVWGMWSSPTPWSDRVEFRELGDQLTLGVKLLAKNASESSDSLVSLRFSSFNSTQFLTIRSSLFLDSSGLLPNEHELKSKTFKDLPFWKQILSTRGDVRCNFCNDNFSRLKQNSNNFVEVLELKYPGKSDRFRYLNFVGLFKKLSNIWPSNILAFERLRNLQPLLSRIWRKPGDTFLWWKLNICHCYIILFLRKEQKSLS